MPEKKRFTAPERYAVWSVHERRCWICRIPLEYRDIEIDHVVPEKLLGVPQEMERVLNDLGLPPEFDINGPENWLPIHPQCNREKSDSVLLLPATSYLLQRISRRAPEVRRKIELMRERASRGMSSAVVRTAIEEGALTANDLRQLGLDLSPAQVLDDSGIVLLQDNHWVFRKDVAYEGLCECERHCCVDADEKVLCVFANTLSPWVIAKRLYWKCYDEITTCPRCLQSHKRGHIGRAQVCGNPYRDQQGQTDGW